jgi:brefeldin A-inhibited guanine nucleotide-exchange protein
MDESPLSTGSREGEEGDKDTSSSSSSSAGNGGRSSTPPASPSATTKEGQQAPPLPPSTPVSTVTSPNMVDVFDRKQKIHEEVDTGILKFNLSAKKGLAYLVQLGHLEKTPQSVAHFFKQYQDRLDKTIIGDYLGREREYEGGFCIMVLHEYVEAMDFQGMVFDMAIRHFLSGFRLPGEAQKIDRIMEKFAERYYLQNSSTFGSADLAFILAFSTIMLQTNLHNPAIRDDKRMTKDQFIKQNKGISTDGDLPDDMLSGIYDRIQAEPISITNDGDNKRKLKEKAKEEANSSFMVFQATSERRKKDAFDSERREMVRAGEAMFKRATLNRGRSSVFLHNLESSKDAYVRPMFDVVWPPTLGVLSQLLEIYDDPALLQLGLEGFHCCIRLACRLDLSIARKTFINALSKFTTLDSVKEMRPKNIMCIQLLLDITLSLGDYLEESWVQVLQLISHLARLQLLSRTDDMFFNSDSGAMGQDGSYFRRGGTDPISKMFLGLSKAENTRLVEEANATLVLKAVDPVLVDRVYSHSINLSGDAVLHFVRGLCEVSRLEISTSSSMNSLRGKDSSTDSSTPRIFSLQKLVEVADFNMHSRSRVEWSNMWNLLAAHFATVGLHDNQALAMYAIDCLRQLSLKFLQKDELSNFNFQRVFLNPFEKIMYATKSLQTKDLVLQCIDIMIKACANNIHSGWRSIFAIFKVAAGQQSLEIATIAFNVIDRLMKDQFNLIIFDFVELLNCLVAFVNGVHTAQSIKAMDFLSQCADHLAQGAVSEAMRRSSRSISSLNDNSSSSGSGSGYESAPQSPEKERKDKDFSFNIGTVTGLSTNDDSSVFRLWWPLLLGLSESVSDPRHEVRLKALDILHAILTDYGSLFSPQTWSVIFKGIVFPIVDSAKTGLAGSGRPTRQQAASKQVWISTMGLKVLTVCLELYMKFRENIENPSISDFILLLEDCICQEIEMLAKMGLEVFCQLVIALGQSVAAVQS